MKHLIIIATLLVAAATSAQTNYEKGMQKAFSLWEANNRTEAEQIFERIAAAEPNEWLPNYYIAQLNSLKTWNEKDPQKVKAQLDKAQDYLNTANGLSKDNADLLVMQAQIYTNWVAFDGMTYGMKYSSKVSELYNKAYKLAPENPMVVFGRADWNMGSARYFGKDTKPFCEDVEKAIELFANFKPETSFHPNWGKERAKEVLASCED
jgi:tetratricopeptide (TPR) repeat protein